MLSWRAINSIGRSSGSPVIDFNRFSARWDSEDETGELHQIVDNFDQNGITLKTQTVQSAEPEVEQEPKNTEISKMAKRALKK